MEIKRHKTRKMFAGNVAIGGNAAISVQSMLKIPAWETKKAIIEIKKLEESKILY